MRQLGVLLRKVGQQQLLRSGSVIIKRQKVLKSVNCSGVLKVCWGSGSQVLIGGERAK